MTRRELLSLPAAALAAAPAAHAILPAKPTPAPKWIYIVFYSSTEPVSFVIELPLGSNDQVSYTFPCTGTITSWGLVERDAVRENIRYTPLSTSPFKTVENELVTFYYLSPLSSGYYYTR